MAELGRPSATDAAFERRDSRRARRDRATRLIPAPAPRPGDDWLVARLASLFRGPVGRGGLLARTSSDSPPRRGEGVRSSRQSVLRRRRRDGSRDGVSPRRRPRRRGEWRRRAGRPRRDASNYKDEQLRSASARERPRRGSTRSIRALDLAVELESASNEWRAEMWPSPRPASLQAMLSREEVFERCKGVQPRGGGGTDARNRRLGRARCVRCRRSGEDGGGRRRRGGSRGGTSAARRRVADAERAAAASAAAEAEAARFARHSPKEQAYDAAREKLTRCGRHSPRRPNSRASRPRRAEKKRRRRATHRRGTQSPRRFRPRSRHRGGTASSSTSSVPIVTCRRRHGHSTWTRCSPREPFWAPKPGSP